MIKQSRIKYDSKGRLADVRTQRDIELYQMWQAGNRQRNTELLEYNKMREYYAAKKIDAPYATLAAFRRARRAQSENYQESRKEWAYKPKESANTQPTNSIVEKPNDTKKYVHIFVSSKLGKTESVLKSRFDIKSESVIITDKQFEKHIAKGANKHDDIYEKVKDNLPNIIEDPDFVFLSDKKENTVIFVSVQHKVQLIIKLNVESKEKSNTIITIFGCGEKTLNRLKRKNEIIYKKGIDK